MSDDAPRDDAPDHSPRAISDASSKASAPSNDAPMAHDEAIGLLDAWRDGELDAHEAARVEAHVASCARCRAVEEALGGGIKSAITGGAASTDANLLPGVQRRLRMRSRGRFYGEREERRRAPSPWPLVVVSLAVLGALIVAYALIGQVAPTPSAPSPSTSLSGIGSLVRP